ncbi:DUF2207 domain-containing protein [Serratia sp. 2723]|uniref:DUF2207 domain-containing protein n=1 Tax=unclassified Serratia (in: enterobacteria) TaxID=2647522 RepID=UPI003D1F2D4D
MAALSGCVLRVVWVLSLLMTGAAQAEADVVPVGAAPVAEVPDREVAPASAPRWVRAYEHILSFDTHAHFNPDGSMEMRENLKVLALGQEIRRGIFRTLPLTWNRQDGKIFSVDYQVKEVLRDGIAEPYSLDKTSKTLTVRIGSAKHTLQPAIYNYQIRYQVSNHFSRFPKWDELYWNVTGNDWAYPITKASFQLELPDASNSVDREGRDTRLRSIDVYTGVRGAKEHHARILPNGGVQTTQPLRQGEGLTVVYTWPRDILADAAAPQASSPLVHLLLPSLATSTIWLPVLLLVIYCLWWWRKNVTAIGLQMPTVVPLYEMPANMSPGYLRFITQRKYDDVAFSSDLLGLVAKRGAAITPKASKSKGSWFARFQSADELWLSYRADDKNKRLTISDKQVLGLLFSNNRKNINLGLAHQRPMQNARKRLEKRSEDQRKRLFSKWGKPVRRAVYITLIIPLICGVFFNFSAAMVTIPALIFLLFGISLLSLPLRFLFSPRKTWNTFGFIPLVIALLFGPLITFGGGSFLFDILPLTQFPAGYIGALLVAILLCIAFGWMIPRYTQRGLNDLATAFGLKLYLGTAERNRYQALYPPDQLVAHFESLLPAALALGVGKTWANTFAEYLNKSGAMSDVFIDADWKRVNRFSHSCIASSMATSSSSLGLGSSGSSSSGSSYSGSGSSGGGSSGGGSGGGGGGGW